MNGRRLETDRDSVIMHCHSLSLSLSLSCSLSPYSILSFHSFLTWKKGKLFLSFLFLQSLLSSHLKLERTMTRSQYTFLPFVPSSSFLTDYLIFILQSSFSRVKREREGERRDNGRKNVWYIHSHSHSERTKSMNNRHKSLSRLLHLSFPLLHKC